MEFDLTGHTLGHYRLLKQLGEGGHGEVYAAVHLHIDRKVAVKVLKPSLAQDHKYVERFRREAEIISRFDHPNIVPIYDYGVNDQGLNYIVMRLLTAGSLEDSVKAQQEDPFIFPLESVVNLIQKVARALDYAHQRRVIHRDVKPSNILFDELGNPYLVDFGIAKDTTEEMTPTGAVVGTLKYMSPEQGHGNNVTAAADQYSLALVAHQLITGHLPIEIQGLPAHEIRHELPPRVSQVLQRAYTTHAHERYPSITQFARELSSAITERHKFPTASSIEMENLIEEPVSPPAEPQRTWILYLVVALLLCLGISLLTWLAFFNDPNPDPTKININPVAWSTPSALDTPTESPEPSVTSSATSTATVEPTDTATASPTATPTASPSNTTTPEPSATPTPEPSNTATPDSDGGIVQTSSNTPSPRIDPSNTQTPTIEPSATETIAPSPTATKTQSPTPTPTSTEEPSATPTIAPSPTLTDPATIEPSATSTIEPASPTATVAIVAPPVTIIPTTTLRPEESIIAFSSNRDGDFDLYLIYEDGTIARQLTNQFHRDLSPAWSPDGSQIAFESIRNQNWDIYRINVDGTGEVRLTDDPAEDNWAFWSPTGTQIAFARPVSGQRTWDIYVMGVDGANQRTIIENRWLDIRPIWIEDYIIFSSYRDSNYELYRLNTTDGIQGHMTNHDHQHILPAVSPDRRQLAFVSNRDGGRNVNNSTYALYTVDLNPNMTINVPTLRRHVEDLEMDLVSLLEVGSVSWSPDSTRIAFTAMENGNIEIFIYDLLDGTKRNLTQNPADDVTPAWGSQT